jgi:signal transduction histidine kinase
MANRRVHWITPHRLEDPVACRSEPPADRRPLSRGARAFVAVDAREMTLRVRDRVRDRAAAKGTHIFVDFASRAAIQVRVQPNAFSEALYELLANAVQVTREGFPVIVSIRNGDAGDVVWEIQETSEETIQCAAAQPGYSLEPSLRKRPGLGVAFPAAVIEWHGGSLRFESAPGIGVKAMICVPGVR